MRLNGACPESYLALGAWRGSQCACVRVGADESLGLSRGDSRRLYPGGEAREPELARGARSGGRRRQSSPGHTPRRQRPRVPSRWPVCGLRPGSSGEPGGRPPRWGRRAAEGGVAGGTDTEVCVSVWLSIFRQ